jgi:hypothetical protein
LRIQSLKQGCGFGSAFILEVGPGFGFALVGKAGYVSAFEFGLKTKVWSFRGSKWNRGGP